MLGKRGKKNHSHWLKSRTLPLASEVHGILKERTFKTGGSKNLALLALWHLTLSAGSWLSWLTELWLGTFGCKCTCVTGGHR